MSMENLKKVVGFGLSVGEAIVAASGQPTVIAKAAIMLHLVEDVPALLGVDYAALKSEISQLTPAELDELNQYIDDNFSLPGDVAKEQAIETAVSVVIDLAKVAEKAAEMWKAKEAPAPAAAPAS